MSLLRKEDFFARDACKGHIAREIYLWKQGTFCRKPDTPWPLFGASRQG